MAATGKAGWQVQVTGPEIEPRGIKHSPNTTDADQKSSPKRPSVPSHPYLYLLKRADTPIAPAPRHAQLGNQKFAKDARNLQPTKPHP